MVTLRSGHSLAELVVAMTILGASLAGMAAVAVVGSRRADEAVVVQRAATLAAEILDSLAVLETTPTSGGRDPGAPGLLVDWEVWPRDAGGSALLVRVRRTAGSDAIVALSGLWIATPPGPIP